MIENEDGWSVTTGLEEYDLTFDWIIPSSISGGEIEDKIKRVLEEMTSRAGDRKYLAQFWAPEAEVVDHQLQLYLTSSHQSFAVGDIDLYKGIFMYRKHCMGHRYRVDGGAQEDELGAVGRVYRNNHPESTPDLRFYSIEEFPLRDFAVGCGGRSYLALPLFDLPKEICYGVIEVLCFDSVDVDTVFLDQALKAGELRTTHLNFSNVFDFRDIDREITKMLELAIRVMPQLQIAQVWVPCHECSKTSNNLSCMERAAFINAGDKEVNSRADIDDDMDNYLEACHLHHLQIGKYKNMIAAVMSSNNKSCICRNICDFSISENPLAHYAQKARLSFCFAIRLQSLHDSRDFYVVEFFLHFNSREDAFAGSFLPLLLRIMEIELKNFKFAYKGQHGEELVVEVLEGNIPSSGESCQSNAFGYEPFKYKHQHSEELSMPVVMEGHKERYPLLDFTKYLQKADLYFLQPSEEREHGWVFWSRAREELPLLADPMHKKIKHLMSNITCKWDWDSYALAQFWAPKVDGDRCYLETSSQPFALGWLHKGLAFFRKQCMEHYYFVDKAAKEEELGPPGRVFLNRHPEISPDLRLYSPTEFPLRNHAANCCLTKYFALPVFELNQHKCVGVLELVEFSDSISNLEVIKNALEAANLRSTHIKVEPGFQGGHLAGNLALTEIKEAIQVVAEIPQLYIAEVWVPYSKCPSSSDTLSCMELAFSTHSSYPPMCQVQLVEPGKGIAGMALASENKSCICQNLCDFSIAEQPLAHYAQQARLGACFAICLQSWHTGDLLYILEFYINQGPGKYKYLRSFVCLLLPILEQKLESFKVASGQLLGEELVVEVIEFSDMNELAFSELDQPDIFPITFKFVKCCSQKHSKDKQVQFAPNGKESVGSVAQAKHCTTSLTNLKKKETTKKTKGGKMKTRLNLKLEDLEPYFGQKLEDVAKALSVSKSTIKRRCRDLDIQMWPWNENRKKNRSLFMRETANESDRDYQQNMCLSSFSNLPPSNMPHHQNVAHASPKSSQVLILQPKADMVVIKVKYEDKTIKFELCHSAGMEKLLKEVAVRLNLKIGDFQLEYLDEVNEKILLTCDADLQLCLKSMGKNCIQMFVQSI